MAIVKAVAGYAAERVSSLALDHLHAFEEELFGKLLSLPKQYVSILLNLDDRIRQLRRILPGLKELTLNAEVNPENKDLHEGFRRFYEGAEDILDEYDTELARRRQRRVADPQPNRFRTLLNLVCSCLPCSSCFDFFDYESVPLHVFVNVGERIIRYYDFWEVVRIEVDKAHPFITSAKDVLRVMSDRTTKKQFEREIADGLLRRDILMAEKEGVEKKAIHDEITFLKKNLPELKMVILNWADVEWWETWDWLRDAKELYRNLKDIAKDGEDILSEFDTEIPERQLNVTADQAPNRFKTVLKLVCGCLPSARFDSTEYEQVPSTYVEIAKQIKGFYDRMDELRSRADMLDLTVIRTKDVLRLMRDQATEEQVDGEITDGNMLRRQFRSTVWERVNKKKVTYEEIKFLRKILPKLKIPVPNTYVVDGQVTRLLDKEDMDLRTLVGSAEILLEAFDRAATIGLGDYLPWFSIFGSLFHKPRTANQIKALYGGLEIVKTDQDRARQFLAGAAEALRVVTGQTSGADGSRRRTITEQVRRGDLGLVGREQDMEEVIKLLLEPSSTPSVVLVKGMGGIGKTTLLQGIFYVPRIADHFKMKKWVCVGNGLNSKAVMKEIFGKEKGAEILPKLKRKRFLIVLDDCWAERMEGWNELWAVLSYGVAGSVVLITSRADVSSQLEGVFSMKSYPLGLLSDQVCIQIFQSYAFGNEVPSSSSITRRLQQIGNEIVEKNVRGLPLTARILGSFLKGKTQEEEWNNVLRGVANKDITEVLMWSYDHLPTDLKQCFSYLSIFPKDHVLEKEEVVWMWIAHGYIDEKDKLTLECIGKSYFDDLVSYSLVQKMQEYFSSEIYYKMHDAVHDLALIVSGPSSQLLIDKCSAVDNKTKLRTLLDLGRFVYSSKIQMQYVRALSLSRHRDLIEINFSKMIYLRYLDLTGVESSSLPESICSLYNLQTLRLYSKVRNFPSGRWKLPNLRHLIGGDEIGMLGIGNSSSLQTISNFNLSIGGEDIEELGNLNELRGKLKINDLNLVRSPRYASRARLNNKMYIEELVLVWENFTLMADKKQNAILEKLCPHMDGNLRILEIESYMGDQTPKWMRETCLSKLVKLKLSLLSHIKELPPLGHLQLLEHLCLVELRNVQSISNEFYGTKPEVFPSLKSLYVMDILGLVEWMDSTDRKDQITSWFPCLECLEVQNCKELTSMPCIPKHLKRLILRSTGLEVLPGIWTRSNESDCHLEEMCIIDCLSLHADEWFQKYRMPSLTNLEFENVNCCIDLFINYSRKCLRSMVMKNMRFLRSITLSNLDILAECREADYKKLSISLHTLKALESISIVNSEDGKITAGRLFLRAWYTDSSKFRESLSKFKLDEEYNTKNAVNLRIDREPFFLEV